MSEIISDYKNKITNLNQRTKEGLSLFLFVIALDLFYFVFKLYISNHWLDLIILDFLLTSFIFILNIRYQFNNYVSIGVESAFSTNSMLMRLFRITIYGIIVQIVFIKRVFSFFNLFLIVFSLLIITYVFYSKYKEICLIEEKDPRFIQFESTLKLLTVVFFLSFLGILLRLYYPSSIINWDEGWYADITARMFQTHNWFIPLYFDDFNHTLALFDKPPLMFILGSIGVQLFGYSSIALKWSMGLFSGLLGLFGYFIFSHKNKSSSLIFYNDNKEIESITSVHEKTSDGNFVGTIFGLLIAVSWFVIFYGRTAYLDAAIISISAFTALFAIRAIDNWFSGNRKRAYIYILIMSIVNMLDLLAKAWQGLVVGPAIAIYLFSRYYQHFVPTKNITKFGYELKNNINQINRLAKLSGFIASLVSFFLFSFFIPNVDSSNKVCSRELVTDVIGANCTVFVPNLTIKIFGFLVDIWSVVVALGIFILITLLTDVLLDHLGKPLTNVVAYRFDEHTPVFKTKKSNYTKYLILLLFSVLNGFISSFVASTGFEFFYSRFYRAFTQTIVTYFPYQSSIEQLTFYGELVDGICAFFFGAILALVVVLLVNVILSVITSQILQHWFHLPLFHDNFIINILLEWSLLLPILLYGLVIIFWVYYLVLKGIIFNRVWYILLIAGLVLVLLAFVSSVSYVHFVTPKVFKYLQANEDNLNYSHWSNYCYKFLIFLSITSILIIFSFLPFLAWIQYMDQFVVDKTYYIRIPGELANSGYKNGDLTYSWLFFDYYLNWRYTGAGNFFTVGQSLDGLFYSPLFLACLPFFFFGIYGYIKNREYSTLLFYLSWLFIVFLSFLPAIFQLNYYYLAVFFPYYGITAYGLFWNLRKIPNKLSFTDAKIKYLLGAIIFILVYDPLIYYPFIHTGYFTNSTYYLPVALGSIFILGGFIICIRYSVRTIPEIISFGFIIFYLYINILFIYAQYVNSELLIFSMIAIGIIIFSIKDRMYLGSAFFLFILILTPITVDIKSINTDVTSDNQIEKMGEFIVQHGGGNASTWVFPSTAIRYSMRYYLHGVHLINDYSDYEPFTSNSSLVMQQYLNANSGLKFFIINDRYYFGSKAISNWSQSYLWLKSHFILVDSLVNVQSWQVIHLYANKTVLTASELSLLGI